MKKKIDNTRDKIDFESGQIGPLFRKMFFPTLVGMLFMSAQTIIEGILVGRGVRADGIAAVNIVLLILLTMLMPKTIAYALECSPALERYALNYLLWLLPDHQGETCDGLHHASWHYLLRARLHSATEIDRCHRTLDGDSCGKTAYAGHHILKGYERENAKI